MTDDTIVQIALTVIGSGALFSFLQFLIQRKDKRNDTNIEKKFDDMTNNFNNQLKEVVDKLEKGIKANENAGKERYNSHKIKIEDMSEHHNQDFKALLQAIDQLKENDSKITNTIDIINENQKNACDALMGLAHDRIIFTSDKIIERGCVTTKEKATLESIYEPYKRMGGNSHAKVGYENVTKLEVVSEEIAKEKDLELKRQLYANATSKNVS
jgi:hypothetical protein